MTPHGVIEDMGRIEGFLQGGIGRVFEPTMWDNAKALVNHAVPFEYGQAAPSDEHSLFGNDLFDRGIFRLPFPVVFMTAAVLPHTAILAHEVMQGDRHHLFCITFGPVQSPDQRFAGAPLMLVRIRHDGEQGFVDWKSITVEGSHRSRKTGRTWEETDFVEASGKVVSFVLGATALLMSKEVETQLVETSAKLNKQRIQKGREPIRDRYVIKIKPEFRQSQREAADAFRSSPRMHWRRGHFRRIREDLVIPIAPTIVNAAEGAKPLAKKYLVNA
jgi:hypothetical protein